MSAAATADAFAAQHGIVPEGVWSSPGRVNLIGEHTDYNLGFVLPFAIDFRTYCGAARNDDGVLRVSSEARPGVHEIPLAQLADATFPDWTGYALGIPWAMQRRGLDLTGLPGVTMHLTSEVPIGAGMSSSAAIEGAVALALTELWGLSLDRMELAHIGRLAENEAVGAPTGIMDQVASLLGRADHAVLLDCDSLEARPVPLGLAAAGLTVLVLDSRVEHRHADGGYASRRAACEAAAAAFGVASLRELTAATLAAGRELVDEVTFRRARHVVTENERVLATVERLAADGPLAIGDLLGASHASMRDDFEISVPEIDLMVDTAVTAGAVGARLTGGGFGGSAVALVPTRLVEEVSRAVLEASASVGYPAPSILTVTPSDGAHRDQ